MIVAVILENDISINDYPYIESVDEIRNDFTPETLLIELAEMPEKKEGYELKYNGSGFYYEEIAKPENETQLDRIEKNVVTLVNDVSVTDVLLGVE